ncbi:Tail fiber protein gp37 C terminal [Salmonella enterica subsp. diarizonae]|uniref:Tail fiber protein gp37 C terminal n=1 Tax=Salmonella diarizonae TaxID=59204 RepID=A0A379TSK9_SALDZ|nr:Tail fiber protein gp37 C terminal [Salmonella enterica subsp. diarizonae]
MTGNLALRSDGRAYFVIQNADDSARAYFYKDKNGDGIHINNGLDGGGDFILVKMVPFIPRLRVRWWLKDSI